MSRDAAPSVESKIWRGALLAIALIASASAIATARAVLEGEAFLDRADAAIRKKDMAAAIAESRAAALWYVPGAPHVGGAYRRLEHIARVSEAQNDPATALDAWRAVRACALETRWLVQPHGAEITAADLAIARLSAPPPPKDGSTPVQQPKPVQTELAPESQLALADRAGGWIDHDDHRSVCRGIAC
ncbi:MAG: hypothetical protein U0165_03895 [Polyangiaceae bacterium]